MEKWRDLGKNLGKPPCKVVGPNDFLSENPINPTVFRNSGTQIIRQSPPVPFVYPVSGLEGCRREMKNHLRYSHTFPTNRPDRESNPGRQCDRPECYH